REHRGSRGDANVQQLADDVRLRLVSEIADEKQLRIEQTRAGVRATQLLRRDERYRELETVRSELVGDRATWQRRDRDELLRRQCKRRNDYRQTRTRHRDRAAQRPDVRRRAHRSGERRRALEARNGRRFGDDALEEQFRRGRRRRRCGGGRNGSLARRATREQRRGEHWDEKARAHGGNGKRWCGGEGEERGRSSGGWSTTTAP